MTTEKKFIVRGTGGKLGWPRFNVIGARKGHSGLDFATVSLEEGDDPYEGRFHMSVEQAERLIEVLPKAIAFAKKTA